jgi:hypothetical protein
LTIYTSYFGNTSAYLAKQTHALDATNIGNPLNKTLAMTSAMAPNRQVLKILPWCE